MEVLRKVVEEVKPHPNADRLELARVEGWQTVVGKGQWKAGDECVYIPVHAVLPVDLSDKLGVTQYLTKGRVRAARLRGEVSYGILMPAAPDDEVGVDLQVKYGIKKYEPILPSSFSSRMGRAVRHEPGLELYHRLQRIQHNPHIFKGVDCVVLEKVHGTNCVQGILGDRYVASSRRVQREESADCIYWHDFGEQMKRLLHHIQDRTGARNVLVYKEVFGEGIQHLTYGAKLDSRVFDIKVDGTFLTWDEVKMLCQEHKVKHVPELFRISSPSVEELSDILNDCPEDSRVGGGHYMEGYVIRPVREKRLSTGDRMIAKLISDAYELDKHATDFH